MKTRLPTNIDDYPLRLALLFEKAYSDGPYLIFKLLKCTNKESYPDFSVFSVFQAKGVLRAKIAKSVCL